MTRRLSSTRASFPYAPGKSKDDETGKFKDNRDLFGFEFCDWLRRGRHFDDWTLLKSVRKAVPICRMRIVRLSSGRNELKPPEDAPTIKISCRYTGNEADNPNSFERQHGALLEVVPSDEAGFFGAEALAHIRANSIFTGQVGEKTCPAESQEFDGF